MAHTQMHTLDAPAVIKQRNIKAGNNTLTL